MKIFFQYHWWKFKIKSILFFIVIAICIFLSIPSLITNYRINGFVQESGNLINEIIVLYKKTKENPEADEFGYIMPALIDYEDWLNDHRDVINKNEKLEKEITYQLQDAMHYIKSTPRNNAKKEMLKYFKGYMKDLEINKEQSEVVLFKGKLKDFRHN